MRTRVLTLALTLALAGCATTRFAVLEGVLVGDRLATGPEMAGVHVSRAGAAPDTVPGMDLRKGDRIVTGPDVGALVTLEAGYELVLEPNTDIEILNPSLFMRAGQAFVQTVARVREYLKIKTEFAVAGVEGTRFVATMDGDALSVSVVDGHVKMESPTGAWPAKVYGPLEQGRVTRTAPPVKMAPLDAVRADAIRARFQRAATLTRKTVTPVSGTVTPVAGTGPAEARVRVPDLTRIDQRRAVDILRGAGLTLGQTSTVEAASLEPGVVARQKPAPGTLVRPGTPVHLQVVAAPATCRVPALRGQTEAQAKTALAHAGLRLGKVQRSGDESSAKDPVTEQRPAAGASVRCGMPVDVVIPGHLR